MKKLGLVGGMGPESTLPYYHDIVYGVQEKTGLFPPLTIESVNVYQVLDCCARGAYGELADYLLCALENLAAAGCDFAALSANTPHIVFDELAARSPLPLVSIVEAACAEAARLGLSRVGLLGTAFTMQGAFYRTPFLQAHIELVTPTGQEQALVNDRIVRELEQGVVREETRTDFLHILRRMQAEEHIPAVLLGCTELPLLFEGVATPVPCLDTLRIHVKTLVEAIAADETETARLDGGAEA